MIQAFAFPCRSTFFLRLLANILTFHAIAKRIPCAVHATNSTCIFYCLFRSKYNNIAFYMKGKNESNDFGSDINNKLEMYNEIECLIRKH